MDTLSVRKSSEKSANAPRLGRWLPARRHHEAWVAQFSAANPAKKHVRLHPAVEAFKALLDSDPIARMYVTRMIDEVPKGETYEPHHLQNVEHLLALLNALMTFAPEFDETALVATPFSALVDWSMSTPSGLAAFRYPPINDALKVLLTAWCGFLSSPASRYVLNASANGWKSAAARKAVTMSDFQYDPKARYWGFNSWNDYFIRKFKPGRRPVAEPDNHKVIVSACESTPFKISADVARRDVFWMKSQPYSLADMLGGEEFVDDFEGGVVYQAYLSALNYHRWHSPVAGTITRAFVQPGSYFSELDQGSDETLRAEESQAYLSHVAVRALIFIDCDDPAIGLVSFIGVGMGEVSSCVIGPDIKAGHHVAKGDELGYFQFGGSTHCLLFRRGVIAEFALSALPHVDEYEAPPLLLGAKLALAN